MLNRQVVQKMVQNFIKFLSSGSITIILECIDHALKDTDTVKFKIETMVQMLITVLEKYGRL